MRNIVTPESSNEDYTGPNAHSLKQLASRLAQWRHMLPPELQWTEDDPTSFPSPQMSSPYNQMLDPQLSPQQQSHLAPQRPPLFSADLDDEPAHYPYLYDIHVALLRTRYYYAKYMIYRPFVYKALHFPEMMTNEDIDGAAECLRVFFSLPPLSHITLTMIIVDLSKMATHSLTNLSEEKNGTLSLLLVPKLPGYPHDASHDAT